MTIGAGGSSTTLDKRHGDDDTYDEDDHEETSEVAKLTGRHDPGEPGGGDQVQLVVISSSTKHPGVARSRVLPGDQEYTGGGGSGGITNEAVV